MIEGQTKQPVVCQRCGNSGIVQRHPFINKCDCGAAADDSAQPSLEDETRVRLQRTGCISAVEVHDRPSQQDASWSGGTSKHKPKALDLFCCAGGAAMGMHRAGFDVVGVDIAPQPRYPFEFRQGDALDADLTGFDFVWASPPCQAHSTLKHRTGREYECFIARTREKLMAWGGVWIIENVMGAPLRSPVRLCGSAFGLNVRRHRIFESNVLLRGVECRHDEQPEPIDVSGTGSRRKGARLDGKGGNSRKPLNLAQAQDAMGMDWTNRKEISQAIPPAFAEFLCAQVRVFLPGFEECVSGLPKGEAVASEGRKYNNTPNNPCKE